MKEVLLKSAEPAFLTPYTAKVHFLFKQCISGELGQAILSSYLENITKQCHGIKGCVIGHIKALVIFSEQEFLRISTVSVNHPADITGTIPNNLNEVELTLNVLVYNVPMENLKEIAISSKQPLEKDNQVQITITHCTA